MVKLVEDLKSLPDHKKACGVDLPPILFLYAFALNRRNKDGDRERALEVIHKVCNSFYFHF